MTTLQQLALLLSTFFIRNGVCDEPGKAAFDQLFRDDDYLIGRTVKLSDRFGQTFEGTVIGKAEADEYNSAWKSLSYTFESGDLKTIVDGKEKPILLSKGTLILLSNIGGTFRYMGDGKIREVQILDEARTSQSEFIFDIGKKDTTFDVPGMDKEALSVQGIRELTLFTEQGTHYIHVDGYGRSFDKLCDSGPYSGRVRELPGEVIKVSQGRNEFQGTIVSGERSSEEQPGPFSKVKFKYLVKDVTGKKHGESFKWNKSEEGWVDLVDNRLTQKKTVTVNLKGRDTLEFFNYEIVKGEVEETGMKLELVKEDSAGTGFVAGPAAVPQA